MAIINFNEERYKENKAVADDLLHLIELIDKGVVEFEKERICDELRIIERKYRQKSFVYRKKI